ncbi:(d)CMP kinase [Streptosporangium sp. NBC_01756]|uniref:(d)CMP kinase n=1 Tax=Streptosporangium sp. NBC_01756 TaxID=2975950 RepID=UPI002DD8E066|nr:(d)CMP kinase [Streptosporangium sp. NBC_01756]WSC85197.1 (d)CMP kinase [Streptosporangium sp. NBC_01756]
MTGLVVAMDGPSGSGKSSASRGVARALGLRYLDTGAMYRAVTWWMLEQGVDLADPAAIAARALVPVLSMGTDPDAPTVAVDGADAAVAIRTSEVTAAVSAISAVPEVRRRLVAEQREIIGAGGIVVEGRDIGTVVTPAAPVKIYLTASADARALRRTAELTGTTVEAQRAAMARRDTLDSTRKTDPLAMAADAVELDTTALNLEEVIAEVLRVIKEKA